MKTKVLSVFFILSLTACNYLFQLNSDNDLTKIIETKIKENPKKISLSNIEDLDYDKLLILEPYSNIEKTEKELKVDLSNISENNIHSSDDINLLVFLKNNKSIKISELPRVNGDFVDYKILIKEENANFEKKEKGLLTLIK
ncbi:hypothetical protein [uncultured Flavobacterium sp.]|uniref:hypothetical protein n=1 Tax=uncultured Flavobacterium sp. TaxID=165435 RepID=UPI0030CA3722